MTYPGCRGHWPKMYIYWLDSCRVLGKYKNPMQGTTFFNQPSQAWKFLYPALDFCPFAVHGNCLTNKYTFIDKERGTEHTPKIWAAIKGLIVFLFWKEKRNLTNDSLKNLTIFMPHPGWSTIQNFLIICIYLSILINLNYSAFSNAIGATRKFKFLKMYSMNYYLRF